MRIIIPNKVKKEWEEWKAHDHALLISLFLQIWLIFFAPSQKQRGNWIVTFSIRSAYLLETAYSLLFSIL